MKMNFSGALEMLKRGNKIARKGWSGKGMWLQLVEMDFYSVLSDKIDGIKTGAEWNLLPWIGMKTADNKFVPWLPSQTDILATDWFIVGE